jgi:hypothetical protein
MLTGAASMLATMMHLTFHHLRIASGDAQLQCCAAYTCAECCHLHLQVVVDRIFARMIACAGIPVALGLVLLYVFYVLKVWK